MAFRGSFLGKMLGVTSPEQDVDAANKLALAGRYLEARALFERAVAHASASPDKDTWQARAREMRDLAAEQMCALATTFKSNGQTEAAAVELRNAAEIAFSPQIRTRAEAELETLEAVPSNASVHIEEISDDQRWAVLVGTWTDKALNEADTYGEYFRHAVLSMHEGEFARAREMFDKLIEKHGETGVYLWLEAGRCAARADDQKGARDALSTFLARVDDEPNNGQVDAYVALAEIFAREDDVAAGIELLNTAVEKMPDHPLPLIALGSYLRRNAFAEEAVSVLSSAEDLMDESQPDWAILTELGMALKAHGELPKALDKLERAAAVFTSRRVLDLPPILGQTLAEVHELTGSHTRAADLYRLLSRGSDIDNRARYFRGAARNLAKIGLADESERLEKRAASLESSATL